jgi:hypothetical protein
MIWLRRGFVWFLSIILLLSLVGSVATIDVNRAVGSPSKLESLLTGSKIYDSVTASALQQAETSASSNGGAGSVSLNDPLVQQAAESVFSPLLVQTSADTFINNNYDWLTGKKPVPDFKIDLSSAKQSFAQQVGQATQTHLAALPVCSATQLSQLSIPVDLLSVTCRPATLDPVAEGDQVAQEIDSNTDFLNNPVLTADSLNQNQFSQGNNSSPSPGQPYYKQLSWAPKVYQTTVKLPWIFAGLILLSVLGIVFIAISRRRGIRRVGVVLTLAGLVLIGLKYSADASVNKLASVSTRKGLANDLKQPVSDFVRQLEPELVRDYLLFGVAFLVIALVIFIVLFRSRQGGDKPAKQRTKFNDPGPGKSPTDASNIKLAPRRSPPASAPELPALRPNPPTPKPSPLGKNPPRRKPPRLVQ